MESVAFLLKIFVASELLDVYPAISEAVYLFSLLRTSLKQKQQNTNPRPFQGC